METFKFTDKKNRSWDLSLDMLAAKRIDNSDFSQVVDIKFSFLDPSKEFMSNLVEKTGFAMAIIWAIVRPQVQRQIDIKDLTEEELESEFLSGFDGASIEKAKECLWGSLGDFFPSMKTVLSKLTEQKKKLSTLMETKLKESEDQIDSYMETQANLILQEALDQLK